MKNFFHAALFMTTALLSYAPVLRADIVEVGLPQLVGQYSVGSRTVTVDLDAEFESIQTVRISLQGHGTPGVRLGDGVERPVNPPFDWPAQFMLSMDPSPEIGSWLVTTGILDGSFEFDAPFRAFPFPSQSWNFLLDGRGDLTIQLSPTIVLGGGDVIEFPNGQITEAHLTVEGLLVPEPQMMTLMLLCVGGACIVGERRSGRWI